MDGCAIGAAQFTCRILLNSQSILQQQSMLQLIGSLLAIPVSKARL